MVSWFAVTGECYAENTQDMQTLTNGCSKVNHEYDKETSSNCVGMQMMIHFSLDITLNENYLPANWSSV